MMLTEFYDASTGMRKLMDFKKLNTNELIPTALAECVAFDAFDFKYDAAEDLLNLVTEFKGKYGTVPSILHLTQKTFHRYQEIKYCGNLLIYYFSNIFTSKHDTERNGLFFIKRFEEIEDREYKKYCINCGYRHDENEITQVSIMLDCEPECSYCKIKSDRLEKLIEQYRADRNSLGLSIRRH